MSASQIFPILIQNLQIYAIIFAKRWAICFSIVFKKIVIPTIIINQLIFFEDRMLRSLASTPYKYLLYQSMAFVVVKPKHPENSKITLNQAPQLFTEINLIRYNQSLSVDQNWLLLMEQFSKLKNPQQNLSISWVLYEQKYRIIDKMLSAICKEKEITSKIQTLITIFFTVWGTIFLKFQEWQKHRDLVERFIFKYGQYNYLFDHDKPNCLTFLKLHSKYKRKFQSLDIVIKSTSQIRVCLDNMLKFKLNYLQLRSFINFFCYVSFGVFYHERNQEICKFIIKSLPDNWVEQPYLTSFYFWKNLNFYIVKYIDQMNYKFLESVSNPQQTYNMLCILIHFKYIRNDNIQKYSKKIVQLISIYEAQHKLKQLFQFSLSYFIYAGIWIQQYWKHFFRIYTNVNALKQQVYIYYVFMLKQLMDIDKDIIPPSIISEANKFFQLIASRGYNLNNFNLISTYNQKYKAKLHKVKSQNFLTASLQLGSKCDIKSQFSARIFIVDIVLNNKIVIEVNSNSHYLTDEKGNKILNLKSEFRQRILKKLGYEIVNIDLDENAQPSFKLLIKTHEMLKNKQALVTI